MKSDTLTTLFRHHLWANLRLFERCAGLTNEQLDAPVVGTYGSIRDTLQHIVGLYHVFSAECLSKYDFGVRIAERFGLDASLIAPVSVEAGDWLPRGHQICG
jgi:uncharacterized damage-inducible protein DinB